MIVTKENQRLYPATWEYNAARITTALARIVENHGGRVKYGHSAVISNRTVEGMKREAEQRLKTLEEAEQKNPGANAARKNAIEHYKSEIERAAGIKNDPITVTHTGYITFILDDVYYYYQTNSNPFFEFYYQKTPVKNNSYSKDACLMEDKKEWLYDCFFSLDCCDADIKEGAHLIFNMLCNAPFSEIVRDKQKKRVPNIYDGGWHYETVYTPERIGKTEF